MELFKKKKKNKVKEDYTIIIGCSRLGANIADALSNEGGNVLIMDKDKTVFRKLSLSFGGLTALGDGTDFDMLQEAEIEKADTVIAVTDNDNTNLMITQIAKEIFHVNRVIARLYDPEYAYIYEELGIDIICPSVLSEKEVDRILSTPKKRNYDIQISAVKEAVK